MNDSIMYTKELWYVFIIFIDVDIYEIINEKYKYFKFKNRLFSFL